MPEDVDPINGLNRSEYERSIRGFVESFESRFPNRVEDSYQAVMWYYTDWPWLDDREKNLKEMVMVSDCHLNLCVRANT